ncbi:DHA2 family efflux MFS transporter permease subunit [Propionicicella superfundia]|uniref:DHA2 family efflux MFS transporter permease subunit n=1 Tax=Propionicicella superfundia TaxID=348582 RepID=UPI0003F59651|nr:DHA2 family efflux MFS transporter permease subunit [Propionicicella superfundia]
MSTAETTTPASDAKPRYTTAERLILTVVVLASTLMSIDMLIVTVALPQIGTDLPGATLSSLQWVVVGYAVAFGALIQPAGSLNDRIGTKRMFIGGMALFTAASLACGLAPSGGMLVAFRLVKGAAAATMFASVMPILARTFDERRRAMAIAIWSAAVGLTSIASPSLGGLLVDAAGWRSMFLINVPLGIVSVVISLRVLPSDRERTPVPGRFDWVGAVLLAGSLGALNYGLTLAQDDGWTGPRVLAWLAGAVVAGTLLVARALRIAHPVLDVRLLSQRTFLGVSLLAVLNRVGTSGATVYIMLYLQSGHGLTPTQTGLLILPLGVCALIGSIVAGALQSRLAPRTVLAVGFALLGASAAVIAWQASTLVDPWWFIPSTMVWGFGNSLANTPLMSVATSAVAVDRVGMATGLINSFYPIGASLGTVLLGAIYTAGVGGAATAGPEALLAAMGGALGLIYLVVAGACAVSVVIALGLVGRDRPAGHAATG